MLKTPLKLILAAAIALPTVLAFSDANARQKKKNHNNSYKYSGGYAAGGHHYNGYNTRRNHYGGGYSVYYAPHYSGGYYYGGHHNRRGHGNTGAYVGLALLGLGLGYAISKSNDNDYRRDQYDDRRYENNNRYYSPPPQDRIYDQNPGAYQSGSNSFDFSQCQETREYQTTIFVDGQEQQAFGTACLMPDGSWVAGPMQIQ